MTRKFFLFLAVTFLSFACEKKSSYQHAEALPKASWQLGQVITFWDTLSPEDPEILHFEINLRHNNTYPYQNIWLYIQTKASDGTTRTDSIDWKLSEPNGRWLGTGWGSLYDVSYLLPDLKLAKSLKSRSFSIEIQHGLRDEAVDGVESIGVRLY